MQATEANMQKLRLAMPVLIMALAAVGTAVAAGGGNYTAHLRGRDEVPPVDTLAQGQAIFHLSDDGSELHYKLIATNIVDILQAHIHVGMPGENGPVVLFLYPDAPPAMLIPGRHTGVLAEGTATAADLRGPLTGATLADLVAAIEAGDAYVNVHTVQNPGGEIRGPVQ
jgi:hypothetical protein